MSAVQMSDNDVSHFEVAIPGRLILYADGSVWFHSIDQHVPLMRSGSTGVNVRSNLQEMFKLSVNNKLHLLAKGSSEQEASK